MKKVLTPAEARQRWNEEVRSKRIFERLDGLLERARNVGKVAYRGDSAEIIDIALGLKELSLRYCIRVADIQDRLWRAHRDALVIIPRPPVRDGRWNTPENMYTIYGPDITGRKLSSILLERVAMGLKPAARLERTFAKKATKMGLLVLETGCREIDVSKHITVAEAYELTMILMNFGYMHPSITSGLIETYTRVANTRIAEWLVHMETAGTTVATTWPVLHIMQGLLYGYPVLDIRSFSTSSLFQSITDIEFQGSGIQIPIEEHAEVQFKRILLESE